jgi:hypothetical protein
MNKEQLALQIAQWLAPLLMALIGLGIAKLTQLINAKVKNEYLKGVLTRLDDAVLTAVKAAEQVLVLAIREANADGKITAEEAAQIKAKVMEEVKSHLGMKGIGELAGVLGLGGEALDKLLGSKIEAAVLDLKARSSLVEGASANPPSPPQP